jgi:hypothetical protein
MLEDLGRKHLSRSVQDHQVYLFSEDFRERLLQRTKKGLYSIPGLPAWSFQGVTFSLLENPCHSLLKDLEKSIP